jgi:hypothetical protein
VVGAFMEALVGPLARKRPPMRRAQRLIDEIADGCRRSSPSHRKHNRKIGRTA